MTFDPALSAMMAEPWSNGACRGYVIMAMENCGFSSDDIRRMMAELHELFGFGFSGGGRGPLSKKPFLTSRHCVPRWSEARGQHRLGAALLRFPTICGRRILFLIRRFYREINGKGTGTNEKR